MRGLLAIPAALVREGADPRMRAALRLLAARLPADLVLVVACHAGVLETVRTWPGLGAESGRDRLRWIAVDDEVDFTAWIQDPFLAARTGDGSGALLFPRPGGRRRDAVLAETIAGTLGIPIVRVESRFEGGNVLVAGDHVLVGADTPPIPFPAGAGGLVSIAVGGGREHPAARLVLVDGPGGVAVEERDGHTGHRQPLYHLDLFLTPAGPLPDGREAILVGDSRLARDLVGADLLSGGDQTVADALDAVACDLGRHEGLAVIRNPLPVLPLVSGGLQRWTRARIERHYAGWPDLPSVLCELDRREQRLCEIRRWRAASQNGCLVFGRPGRGRVLLPSYADGPHAFLAPAEAENERIWRALGYEVERLPGSMALAAENGSHHCLFKAIV